MAADLHVSRKLVCLRDIKYCDVVLINPPIVDPTTPPHFAAYLVGNLRRVGCDASIRFDDLSVGALEYLTGPEGFQRIQKGCEELRTNISKKESISKLEELQYKHAFKIIGITYDALCIAKHIIKTGSEFYNFGRYKGAARLISRYIDASTALSLPGMFSFWELDPSPYGSLSSIEDLANPRFIDALCEPFRPYLEKYVEDLVVANPVLVGVSCNYISQLPYAIFLARQLVKGGFNVCIGGTELTDLYKHISTLQDIWKIFPRQTVLVIGEGESAFEKLVDVALRSGKLEHAHLFHENVVTNACLMKKTSAFSEDINAIGNPDYTVYDLPAYWSPEPVIMYSPTRGCYWNKCTFCDYGLNFGSPTSPSRQRDLLEVKKDLLKISQISRVLYFAVDAIAPSYLLKICSVVQDLQIKLNWSAEIRLEKHLSDAKLAAELRNGGCIALSFGLESGVERILRLINKGIDISRVPDLLYALANEDIHTQLMGFVGFPTETSEEAEETFKFLRTYKNLWTLAGIGSFVLTPGAEIAKNPGRFGIQDLISTGDGITRSYVWNDAAGNLTNGSRHDGIRSDYAALATRVELTRPFVGGIDTAHSLLYFARFSGAEAFLQAISSQEVELVSESIAYVAFAGFMDFWDSQDLSEQRYSNGMVKCFKDTELELSIKRPVIHKSRQVIIKPSGTIYLHSDLPKWIKSCLI